MKFNEAIQVLIDKKPPRITLAELAEKTGFTEKYCKRVMKEVVNAGLARFDNRAEKKFYVIGSRQKLKGLLKTLQRPNKNRDKIWHAIRILKPVFNRKSLSEISSVNPHTVDDYLKVLAHHKILVKVDRGRHGTNWQLIKDLGPQRPVLSEKPKKKDGMK